jgi:uncharacterized protein (TIGR02217 family)
MSFLEIEFPRKLALGAVGGPGYSTIVNAAFSGYEQRNQNWSQSRAQWTVSYESKPLADYQQLLAYFHAVRGMANGFRLFDLTDYSGTGQFIATGDGSTVTFQLQKTYTFPLADYQVIRPVQKPLTSFVTDYYGNALTDTVNVYLNAALKTHSAGYHTAAGHDYTLDETTGLLTFATAPALGVIVTADYQYHFPVRFDLDDLQTTYKTGINAGTIVTVTGLKLIEVRIEPGQAS